MSFKVESSRFEILKERIEKLNIRAVKLGCAPVELVVLSEEHQKVNGDDSEDGLTYLMKVVEIRGEAPSLAGWLFAGSLDIIPGEGTVIRSIPSVGEMPAEYRTLTESRCDHCRRSIRRVSHYVVRHRESGEWKIVGSSCIHDFLGHDPERAMAGLWLIFDAEDACRDLAEDSMSGGGGLRYVNTLDYLRYVAASIRLTGWTSRGAAYTSGGLSTADHACTLMIDVMKGGGNTKIRPTQDDHDVAVKAIEWAKALGDDGANLSDYEHNLKLMASCGRVPLRAMGIVASIVASYRRSEERRLLAERTKASAFVGQVGDKIAAVVSILYTMETESMYGVTTLYRMIADDGNVYTWWSSRGQDFPGSYPEGETCRRLAIGDRVLMRGRVKGHDEFRGIKQTVMTRCTLLDANTPPEPPKKARKPKKDKAAPEAVTVLPEIVRQPLIGE